MDAFAKFVNMLLTFICYNHIMACFQRYDLKCSVRLLKLESKIKQSTIQFLVGTWHNQSDLMNIRKHGLVPEQARHAKLTGKATTPNYCQFNHNIKKDIAIMPKAERKRRIMVKVFQESKVYGHYGNKQSCGQALRAVCQNYQSLQCNVYSK